LYNISLSFQALKELEEAQDWYKLNEVELGLRFYIAVENAINALKQATHFAIGLSSS
jgi:hypothetical protein